MNQPVIPAITRRRFLFSTATGAGIGAAAGIGGALWWATDSITYQKFVQRRRSKALADLAHQVVSAEGYTSDVSFGDSIQRLIKAGVISSENFVKSMPGAADSPNG